MSDDLVQNHSENTKLSNELSLMRAKIEELEKVKKVLTSNLNFIEFINAFIINF